MPPTTIENPILNSAFTEPLRHFKFDDEGITSQIENSRRTSSYFIPVPRAQRRGQQRLLEFDERTEDIRQNEFINGIRERVARWRMANRPHITPTTRRLIEYWTREDRGAQIILLPN